MRRFALSLILLLCGAGTLHAQSMLERSPNLQGVWTLEPWHPVFNFAHRFQFFRGGDELANFPTLTLGLGLPLGLTAGLDYTSFSEVVPDQIAGNETQYWLKRALSLGSRTRASGMIAYNTAASSVDGALDLHQEFGRVALIGELRGFSDLFGSGEAGAAGAVGAIVRLTDYLGVTGDIGQVLTDDYPAAWSAGLSLAIPGTPHTLSLQAANSGALTLQGVSRKTLGIGTAKLEPRYGFVFTVPLGTGSQWARIFRPSQPPAPVAAGDSIAARVEIRQVAFTPQEIRIRAGESVEWINRDPVIHTVTAADNTWSSENLEEGERYVRRFDQPGRYPYTCLPHPMMTAVVIVEAP